MLTAKELSRIDTNYFIVIDKGCYGVSLVSKNTGHGWYIANKDYGTRQSYEIHHSHHGAHTPTHFHGRGHNLGDCIRQIKKHDIYQIERDKRRNK